MDNSGNNRYELLFMDDEDAGGPKAPLTVPVPATAAAPAKAPKEAAPKAPKPAKSKPEKENKPLTTRKPTQGNANTHPNALAKPAGKNATRGPVTANGSGSGNGNGNGNPGHVRANNQRFGNRDNNNYSGNNNNNSSEFGNELPQRQFNNRDNRGGGGGGGGGAARFRGGEKFGKREFDRQSGSDKTGVKAIDKREGGGAHNWGSPKQDIEDLKTGEAPAPQTDKDDSANEQTVEAAIAAEEDESKQMTLDEWKALRDQRAKPNYNLRKAGEGVDNSEWKKMIVLSKKKESNSEDELEYDPSLYPQRVGRLQRIVDIQFNFNDGRKPGGFRKGPRPGGPREGGFRGGEGGFRGEGGARGEGQRGEGGFRSEGPRGEGGFRGPRFNQGASNGYERSENNNKRYGGGSKPLKVDDEAQFPTLS
ncbi:hypothetical protein KR018_009452 [Drosophila ironensis]|nr:hypothetical protein KR018_009452 [Drosophila ironensis]